MKIGEFSRNDNDQDWKRKSVMTNLTPDIIPRQQSFQKSYNNLNKMSESFERLVQKPILQVVDIKFSDKLNVPNKKKQKKRTTMHINFDSQIKQFGSPSTSVQQSPSKVFSNSNSLSGINSSIFNSKRNYKGIQTQEINYRSSSPHNLQSQLFELKKLQKQKGQIGVMQLETQADLSQQSKLFVSKNVDRKTNFDLNSASINQLTMSQSCSRQTNFDVKSSIISANTQQGKANEMQSFLQGYSTSIPQQLQQDREQLRKTTLIKNYHTAKSTCQRILAQKIEKQREKQRLAQSRVRTPIIIQDKQINKLDERYHSRLEQRSVPLDNRLKGIPQFIQQLDHQIQEKKDNKIQIKKEHVKKVREYHVDKSQHYQIVKKNAFLIEQRLSSQSNQNHLAKPFQMPNQNDIEKAQMRMKINVKRNKVKFHNLFEEGQMYYGCRNKLQEQQLLADGEESHGELSARAESRKQKNLSNVIKLMEGQLRWGVDQRAKQAIPLEACLQSYRRQSPLFSGRSDRSEISTERAMIEKYGRFRYLVAKHFLSKTLQQIDEANNRVNMRQVTKVLMLFDSLDKIFPHKSVKYFSFGQKYQNLSINLFQNTYSRERQYMLQDYSIEIILEFERIQCNQSYLYDLNCLLRTEMYQNEYFEHAKKINPQKKGDQIAQAMQKQAAMLKKEQSMIVPYLIGFLDKTVYIKDRVISQTYAESINYFFQMTAGVSQFQVNQLIIESCNFADETLRTILHGLKNQGTFLKAIIINNSEFGKESVNMICSLLPGLRELRINNINDFSTILSRQMLETIVDKGRQMQILKLSNVSLNCDKSIQILCKHIKTDRFFHTLELSNSCLRPRHLYAIAKTLKASSQHLKVLDLSYNSLWTGSVCKTEEQIEKQQEAKQAQAASRQNSPKKGGNALANDFLFDEDYAVMFMDAMVEYIKETDLLNHINLSGLQIKYVGGGAKFQQLAQAMHQCSNLLAIHLSDNDLIMDKERAECDPTGSLYEELEYFEETIHLFGLQYSDIFPLKNRSSGQHHMKKPKSDDNFSGIVRQAHLLGLTKDVELFSKLKTQHMSTYRSTTSTVMDSMRRKKVISDQSLHEERYHLMIEKQLKFVSQNKFLHDSREKGGIGRSQGENPADQFILTRTCTFPELVFNQDFRKDKFTSNHIDRCFDIQNAFKWNFSNKNDGCYICQKHTYTVIFFDQDNLENNKDLVEINDQASLNKIRTHLNKINGGSKAINKLLTKSPHIFGSVVKQERTCDLDIESGIVSGTGDKDFKRSLRMIRADLFSLLSVSQTIKFVKKRKDFRAINEGVHNMLQMQEIMQTNPSTSQQGTPRQNFFSPRTVSDNYATRGDTKAIRRQTTVLSTQIIGPESSKSSVRNADQQKPQSFKKSNEDEQANFESSMIIQESSVEEDDHQQSNSIGVASNPDFLKKLNGWNKYLSDKCTENELVDVRRINYPSELGKMKVQRGKEQPPGISAYACLLPPGYHQFIVYDPQSKRAFCKEMVIDLNNQTDQFPELPRQIGAKNMEASVPNIWHPWKKDSKAHKTQALGNDIKQQTFELDLFIKSRGQVDEDAIKAMHELVKTHWEIFKTMQKIMAAECNKYPDINFEVIYKYLLSMQNNQTDLSGRQPKLNRGQFELLFIRSTRNDKEAGLASFMGRGEMMEIFARYSQQAFKSRDHVANFTRFIEQYLKPVHDQSELVLHRKEIRSSEKVNWLLHDNKNQLKKLFDDFKENKQGFTMKSANKLFNTMGILPKKKQMLEALRAGIQKKLNEKGVNIISKVGTDSGQLTLIHISELIKCFCYSQMTVLDEQKNKSRFYRLVYVEFLEMICRVAIKISKNHHSPVENKIYDLLYTIFERRYSTGRETREAFPLREVRPDESDSEEY